MLNFFNSFLREPIVNQYNLDPPPTVCGREYEICPKFVSFVWRIEATVLFIDLVGGVQNIRGTPEEEPPGHSQHNIRHFTALWLHRTGTSTSGFYDSYYIPVFFYKNPAALRIPCESADLVLLVPVFHALFVVVFFWSRLEVSPSSLRFYSITQRSCSGIQAVPPYADPGSYQRCNVTSR